MTTNDSERELVQKFSEFLAKKQSLSAEIEENQKKLDQLESLIIELLEAKDATATAEYDGIGKVQINKPKLHASVKIENMDKVKEFLATKNRLDLVRETINANSLSTFTKELIEKGEQIPSEISYYLKPVVKLYK